MERMHDHRYAFQLGSQSAQRTGLGRMGMNDMRLVLTDQLTDGQKGLHVPEGIGRTPHGVETDIIQPLQQLRSLDVVVFGFAGPHHQLRFKRSGQFPGKEGGIQDGSADGGTIYNTKNANHV